MLTMLTFTMTTVIVMMMEMTMIIIMMVIMTMLELTPFSSSQVRFRLRVRPVQVAEVAQPTVQQAEDHLGIQDSLPGRPLPAQPQEDHLRRHGPDHQDRLDGAQGPRPRRSSLRIHSLLRQQRGDGGLQVSRSALTQRSEFYLNMVGFNLVHYQKYFECGWI